MPKMELTRLKTKKMAQSDVSAKLRERKNSQVPATIETSSCILFSKVLTRKNCQNSLISKSEKFLELSSVNFRTQKFMAKMKRVKNLPKTFV
jgi:hypothetical protein